MKWSEIFMRSIVVFVVIALAAVIYPPQTETTVIYWAFHGAFWCAFGLWGGSR